jgi:hypothetical protein
MRRAEVLEPTLRGDGCMRLAAVSLFVIATAFFLLPASTHASPKMQRAATRIVPNGTSFVAIPFPSPQPSGVGNVVFLPNGTAYFTDAKNEIASFTAAGVYTRIPVAHAVESYTLLYARSVFWMAADEGIVKVAPDGTSHRWYPMTVPGNVTYIQAIVAGPDGAIYAPAVLYSKVNGAPTNVLFRISSTGSVSTLPLSVTPVGNGAAVFGPDGLLYFGYLGAAGTSGVARLESDGSLTVFPIAGSSQTGSFVVSKGNIYFNNFYYDSGLLNGQLGRITPTGVVTLTAFPATGPNTGPSALSVDKGGNLWVAVDNAYGVNQFYLYQFNTYTGHFNGPYLTGLPNLLYNGPVVAPDNDVWIVLPGTSGVRYFQPIGFGIFERST